MFTIAMQLLRKRPKIRGLRKLKDENKVFLDHVDPNVPLISVFRLSCKLLQVLEWFNEGVLIKRSCSRKTRRASIIRMAMLWVERRAQVRAWVSSLVTKSDAAFCENARISSFIFRRAYRLGYAFHAILYLAWRVRPNSDILPSTWHPYRFQKFDPAFSIPVHLPSAWKVW